ncbi:MAG TPA: CUAEP/CCAEP-tail radical SAM protein [Chloroflexota bacterium]|nr:CUAEP/CCAEP-tail radical SAM protein [Chloroflexota bacterium]
MNVVLLSTYELGHQPFGLASPAAWLQEAGAAVTCVDLAVQPETASGSPLAAAMPALKSAQLIALYLPMHTATRLAAALLPRLRRLNPTAHLCAYGLYAPVNENYLRQLGVQTILGGEFEQGLVDLYAALAETRPIELPPVSLARQQFRLPTRTGLPGLEHYAHLQLNMAEKKVVGYTEASRGCKHLCRHCPVVPVYNGRFRIIQPEIVLADIRQQVAAGAQHITFGDPDFFNGPGHAARIVQALHQEFPQLTYDVVIKIEHLLRHAELLPRLRQTGCLFITSAVESLDDHILQIFDKRHTRADFLQALALCQAAELLLAPTFVSFTPWTTRQSYVAFLAGMEAWGLVDQVSPIQYAIRLLIPAGSKLLELEEVQELVRPFDDAGLVFPWAHPDPEVDSLYETIFTEIKASQNAGESRRLTFERIWQAATAVLPAADIPPRSRSHESVFVPTLSEEWY